MCSGELADQEGERRRDCPHPTAGNQACLPHGWTLAFYRRPLFRQPVEAWPYGPVIADVYHNLKQYRANPIGHVIPGIPETQFYDQELDVMEEVYRVYGDFSGIRLSALTHHEGSRGRRPSTGLAAALPSTMRSSGATSKIWLVSEGRDGEPTRRWRIPRPAEETPTDMAAGEEDRLAQGQNLDTRRQEHWWRKWVRGIAYSVLCVLMIVLGLVVIGIIVCLAAHYFFPESWHWISQQQIDRLETIAASSVVTALSAEIGRRFANRLPIAREVSAARPLPDHPRRDRPEFANGVPWVVIVTPSELPHRCHGQHAAHGPLALPRHQRRARNSRGAARCGPCRSSRTSARSCRRG